MECCCCTEAQCTEVMMDWEQGNDHSYRDAALATHVKIIFEPLWHQLLQQS